ncbi:LysR substrate-binding domain-containing protein [Leisingera caerulea]|uniref:LysR family transcriptional regulator n=1 Tax=Leisingera caerulea TaxID=506591 RepID=A0A9Q9M531_LEICA|nr:LysR substrate-binding domain-containing protein [Leisingera caerulea]UWQ56423.1 LysR family transcriptional regulator [Leisingera caerulea]
MRLPSLTHLRCFESAARHQSFTAAGEELGLTQSAVSKKVKELEADLGFDLFQRAGRGVVLTPAGQGLAADLELDLAGLRATMQKAAAAGAGRSALRIAVLPAFANLWLIPRLPDFFERHPNVELSFSTRLEPFDFARETFDLAVHYGLDNWPGTHMAPLFGEEMVPVCAPAFYGGHKLEQPVNLAQAPLLHLESRAGAWAEWFERAGLAGAPRQDGRYFDQHSMVIAAAAAGLGAAIVPYDMVAREIAAGDLLRIPGPALESRKRYYLVRPHGPVPEAVQKLEGWMRKQLRTRPD